MKSYVVKKNEYNAKIKDIEIKIPNITNLATNASLNTKINDVKKTSNITNLAITDALTVVENKIPNVSDLVEKADYDTKTSKMEKKFTTSDHSKFTNSILDANIAEK